jgi:DNA-directed RNA polymerase specialized sigma24 family protein
MPSNPELLASSFLPEEPAHPKGAEFFEQVTEMLDGKPKDAAVVEAAMTGWEEMIERIAANSYRIASMLIGEGEEAVGLIEQVITEADLSAAHDHLEARHNCRLLLAGKAIGVLSRRDAASLAAPAVDDSGPVSCIDGDDLDAAGITSAELEEMLTGPDSQRLRSWLEGLSIPLRVVFVLRAVAGLTSAEIAGLLGEHGGPPAHAWTPDAVRTSFRQALCSLASQLLHATAAR